MVLVVVKVVVKECCWVANEMIANAWTEEEEVYV
jgi:hypothetical protein